MIRVMFICHGNICRSPMAEFLFRDLVRRRGCSEWITCASSATSREELGNPVHPGAREKLRQTGIPCSGKRAIRLVAEDYGRYDYLVCMDSSNLRNALHILGDDPENKLTLLLSHAGRMDNIADPWYTGNFDDTYQDVLEGCRALLDKIYKTRG